MIPAEITRDHVVAAIREIDKAAIPWHRTSSKFDLVFEGKKYPPKYVISRAGKLATGKELDPDKFSGGDETNSFLGKLGFQVVTKPHEGLRDVLEFILSRYGTARKEELRGNEIRNAFRKLEEAVIDSGFIEPRFRVSWGIGQGRWASVPWLAIFDPRETNTIQKGVYCVFLFRGDCSGVYLTLNQGITDVMEQFGAGRGRTELLARADPIRKQVRDLSKRGFQFDNDVDLRTTATRGLRYQDATVAHKLYEQGAVPSDAEIISDLEELLKAYSKYVDSQHPENIPHQEAETSVRSEQASAIELSTQNAGSSVQSQTKFNRAQALANLIEAVEASGFIFEPWQIATYVTALRTKPFVILAGISGTGKSKLPALVQAQTGGISYLVPVRPDWTDSSDVLGYSDLQGKFKEGLVLSAADSARHKKNQYVVCVLDEMNLARVEQYFAEILSKIEDRHPSLSGGFESDPLLATNLQPIAGEWSHVNLPSNFALVGTVNMDETTHGFSRKVLDRAFTIELSDVDLSAWGSNELIRPASAIATEMWPLEAWVPRAISLATLADTLSESEQNEVQGVIDTLIELNQYLSHAQLQVGYRIRDEISLFVLHALDTSASFVTRSGAPVNTLDLAIELKILPRIIGGSSAIRRLLRQLIGWAQSGRPLDDDNEADQIIEEWDKQRRPAAMPDSRFPRTVAKLCLMWERLSNEGYTSFWL